MQFITISFRRVVFTLLCLSFFHSAGALAKRTDVELFVHDPLGIHRTWIRSLADVTIDHPNQEGYEAYGPPALVAELEARGIVFWNIRLDEKDNAGYPTYLEIQAKIQELAARFPRIMRLFSIGKSVEGRDLWVIKISDNPELDELEPEVKYISSMHGNEITGRELMISLIEEIGVRYMAGDSEILRLVDNLEVYIMPSMNPDGSEYRQRGNARNVDLNRDFPDFSTNDNQNVIQGRQPETVAVMNFQRSRQFVLSANFHGGAECVNYPWDTTGATFPFEALIRDISLGYAGMVPYMRDSTEFTDGITNGYEWYEVDGGMQDWSYHWHNDLQVTIELSDNKWPAYRRIPYYYETNRQALLAYLANATRGAGFVFAQEPGVTGTVAIAQKNAAGAWIERGNYAFQGSEFFKVLDDGIYRFRVNRAGATDPQEFEATVARGLNTNPNYQVLR